MCDYGLHSWDIAAGVLLVEEAGGVVLDPTNCEYIARPYLKMVTCNHHIT